MSSSSCQEDESIEEVGSIILSAPKGVVGFITTGDFEKVFSLELIDLNDTPQGRSIEFELPIIVEVGV